MNLDVYLNREWEITKMFLVKIKSKNIFFPYFGLGFSTLGFYQIILEKWWSSEP